MHKILIKFFILLIFAFVGKSQLNIGIDLGVILGGPTTTTTPAPTTPPATCEDNIHNKCMDEEYTAAELEVAKNWLQARFKAVDPNATPCETLRVRRDIKCYSNSEREALFAAMRALYADGTVDNFTAIHVANWPIGHKFSEGLLFHRWFANQFELQLQRINKDVTLPYWDFYTECAHPVLSKIWQYFGKDGVAPNYCVTDGTLFNGNNITVNNGPNGPNRHCIARQWNTDGTIDPWESPEWVTAINQMRNVTPLILQLIPIIAANAQLSGLVNVGNVIAELTAATQLGVGTLCDPTYKPYAAYAILIAFIAHFKTHLPLGGWPGDLSVSDATNDMMFYLFHSYQLEVEHLKWQMSDRCNRSLVPTTYSLGLKLNGANQKIYLTNINTDNLTYYNVSIKSSFEVGMGDLCYIPARHIKPINRIVNKVPITLPVAYQRLKDCLSDAKFKRWFPRFDQFANTNSDLYYYDFHLPDVGNCNSRPINGECRQCPTVPKFNANANNQRQFAAFETVVYNMSAVVKAGEDMFYEFVNDLNDCGYCSPYC